MKEHDYKTVRKEFERLAGETKGDAGEILRILTDTFGAGPVNAMLADMKGEYFIGGDYETVADVEITEEQFEDCLLAGIAQLVDRQTRSQLSINKLAQYYQQYLLAKRRNKRLKFFMSHDGDKVWFEAEEKRLGFK